MAAPAYAITPEFLLQILCSSWDYTVTKSYSLFIGTRASTRADNLVVPLQLCSFSCTHTHWLAASPKYGSYAYGMASYAHTQTFTDNDSSETAFRVFNLIWEEAEPSKGQLILVIQPGQDFLSYLK